MTCSRPTCALSRMRPKRIDLPGEPDLNAALRIPGMLERRDHAGRHPRRRFRRPCCERTAEALVMLNAFREREGAATAANCASAAKTSAAWSSGWSRFAKAPFRLSKAPAGQTGRPAARRRIDPQRLAQEAALLADRSDIAEELVRLRTHAEQLESMLKTGGEVGKRLDFLLQEMNREANTILSKTGGLGDLGLTITDLALAAKSEIDKIREQSLNLE